MTERSVVVSMAVSVAGGKEHEFEFEIEASRYYEKVRSNVQGLGEEIIGIVVRELDDRLAGEVPAGWKNLGREKRRVVTAVGEVSINRRVYRDEAGRRQPLDDVLGLKRYERLSNGVKQLGAYLASNGSYRQAAAE